MKDIYETQSQHLNIIFLRIKMGWGTIIQSDQTAGIVHSRVYWTVAKDTCLRPVVQCKFQALLLRGRTNIHSNNKRSFNPMYRYIIVLVWVLGGLFGDCQTTLLVFNQGNNFDYKWLDPCITKLKPIKICALYENHLTQFFIKCMDQMWKHLVLCVNVALFTQKNKI